MNRGWGSKTLGVLMTSFVIAVTVGALASTVFGEEEEMVTLSGELDAAEFSDEGDVLSVLIDDPDWGSVLVIAEDDAEDLLDAVGAQVTITGRLVELEEGEEFRYAIEVISYTIHDEEEDPDLLLMAMFGNETFVDPLRA